MKADALEALNRLIRSGEKFDVVIIDPPSFTPRQASVARALTSYALLTEKGVHTPAAVEPDLNMSEVKAVQHADDLVSGHHWRLRTR
jgi:hypothetical protein